jgi:hypothetical protein
MQVGMLKYDLLHYFFWPSSELMMGKGKNSGLMTIGEG